MLYLEDFIELIEQLPQDLRDRCTEMRELDLKVQNTIDSLDTRVRRFFSDGRRSKPESLEEDYKSIHASYKAALDDADEKVSMASQIYDLVDRHLRKLDQELSRFKMELEADCSGITEILEKRSMLHSEDTTPYNTTFNHTEPKKRFGDLDRFAASSLTNGLSEKTYTGSYSSPLGASYPLVNSPKSNSMSQQSSNKKLSAIGAATPKSSFLNPPKTLISDTKEEGRGVQSALKAMTAAQKKAEQLGNSLSLSGLLGPSTKKESSSSTSTTSSSTTSSSYVDVTSNSHLPSSSSTLLTQKQAALQQRSQKANRRNQKTVAATTSGHAGDKGVSGPTLDWVPDPNEPTYCLCNQVSYGEMVGCDNASCPIEWFHYGCVGLTDAPKGKWYCPDCAAQIKKRRIR